MDPVTDQAQDTPSPPPSPEPAEGAPAGAAAPAKPGRRGRAVQVDVAAAPAVPPETIGPSVEAILLTSERPVSAPRLAEALGLIPAAAGRGGDKADGGEAAEGGAPRAAAKGATETVGRAVEWLNGEYERTGRAFRIEAVAGGYRLMTLPAFAAVIEAFQGSRARSALSHAALETLAIIAYKQPVTRAQLEAIRGVASGEVLRTLIDRRLVTIAGRAEELGRPLLYGTTKQFLEIFGLSSLKDLPSVEELRQRGLAGVGGVEAGKVEE